MPWAVTQKDFWVKLVRNFMLYHIYYVIKEMKIVANWLPLENRSLFMSDK
jgi:hypothetical protein